jgi:RNA polymerase sigma-70 factor (ECF subfamily)
MDELKMIQGCINNDRRSQEFLYKQYYSTMRLIVKKYVKQDEIIDEILNSGYLRIFKCLHQYKYQGSFEGWMRRIMCHAVSDYFRDNRRYQDNVILHDLEREVEREKVYDNINYKLVLELIETLPKATNDVIKLNMEGLNHKEIGKKLGITPGTSKWHLSVGRKTLREKLNKLDSYINLPQLS